MLHYLLILMAGAGDSGAAEVKLEEEGEVPLQVIIDCTPLAPDIQAIMLRWRTRYYGHGEPEPLNLHGADLRYLPSPIEGTYFGMNQEQLEKANWDENTLLSDHLGENNVWQRESG